MFDIRIIVPFPNFPVVMQLNNKAKIQYFCWVERYIIGPIFWDISITIVLFLIWWFCNGKAVVERGFAYHFAECQKGETKKYRREEVVDKKRRWRRKEGKGEEKEKEKGKIDDKQEEEEKNYRKEKEIALKGE